LERLLAEGVYTTGDAPPRRASPLVVTVPEVRQYGSTCCVDSPHSVSGRPREPIIKKPILPLTTDWARQRNKWQRFRVGDWSPPIRADFLYETVSTTASTQNWSRRSS